MKLRIFKEMIMIYRAAKFFLVDKKVIKNDLTFYLLVNKLSQNSTSIVFKGSYILYKKIGENSFIPHDLDIEFHSDFDVKRRIEEVRKVFDSSGLKIISKPNSVFQCSKKNNIRIECLTNISRDTGEVQEYRVTSLLYDYYSSRGLAVPSTLLPVSIKGLSLRKMVASKICSLTNIFHNGYINGFDDKRLFRTLHSLSIVFNNLQVVQLMTDENFINILIKEYELDYEIQVGYFGTFRHKDEIISNKLFDSFYSKGLFEKYREFLFKKKYKDIDVIEAKTFDALRLIENIIKNDKITNYFMNK